MRFWLILLAVLSFSAQPPLALAQGVEINVDEGVVQPLPIALPALPGEGRAGELGAEIARVVAADLERSGFFRPVPVTGRTAAVSAAPRFEDWRGAGAQALLAGRATLAADGRLQVDFRLWDVIAQRELGQGQQFMASEDNVRRIAHKIADVIYERLTGQRGYFDTRIVFVSETGPKTRRVKRLTIMDQDGANPSFLTDGSALVLTPRFSRTNQEISYVAIQGGRSRVYLLNLETGRREVLAEVPGMVFAPRFSPDGRRIAYSQESRGNSDIYVMDLASRSVRRLTSDPGIDTSPSFSPDGSQIVFNSDRGGSPQLYVMGANGGGARRVSFGTGRYSTPVWSPKGDLIAFTRQTGGRFGIGVMAPDGSGERMLTDSYLDEGPAWSPNGRVVIFFREPIGEAPRLWTVDVSGRNPRPAPYPTAGSDPAWSPVLE
ncbi:MAG TPA: Tol-Pal system beta propeller repeat protein TolB [Caulobacteraceae bacterium]|jgi:TolB protein